MKVLAVSHSCVTDVNQQLYIELNGLPETSVELIVPSVWKGAYSAEPHGPGRLSDATFPMHSLPIRAPGQITLHHYRKGLMAILRRFRPDVVFVDEEPWSLSMAQMVWLCRRARLPIVAYTKQNILKSLPLPFRRIEQRTYAAVGSIAVISEEVREVLRRKGYTGRCPLLVHGCDLSLFQPKDSIQKRAELGLKGVVIGYMGRLVPDKGLDTLIEAAGLLKARAETAPFSLLFVGAGVQEAELRQQASAAGLSEQTVFCGVVPHVQAGEYMNCMDLFVLPSRTMPNWKEQFGRVIVESLACGVPVIGSDSGQIPYVIADTGGGLVFREGDAADLAANLASLVVDSVRRAALGAAGREAVRCRYTYNAVAHQLHEILEQACER